MACAPDHPDPARHMARFLTGPAELAGALARLGREDAVSLPLLSAEDCTPLIEVSAGLTYRPATPVIGEGARRVQQDFELCADFAPGHPFHGFAAALESLTAAALARLDPPPLHPAPPFNDLIVQRYGAGSAGITPHRDHIRYRGLVAIVTLVGRARFCVCTERSGRDAREVPIPPGSLLLMRAPGFAGRDDRPFHLLKDVVEERICLGLRHDVQAA